MKVQIIAGDELHIKLTREEAVALKFASEHWGDGDTAKLVEGWLSSDLATDLVDGAEEFGASLKEVGKVVAK